MQLLRLWWRQTSLTDIQAGPAMAGRLRGSAFQFALRMSANRLDVTTGERRLMSGDELLAQPRHDDYTHGDGTFHARESAGAQHLLEGLEIEYGLDAEDRTIAALGSFFNSRRGNQSMEQYISMHELAFDEAVTDAGLQMNAVGRSWFLMQGSGLSDAQLNDFKLRIDGDLTRYQDLRNLLRKFSPEHLQQARQSTVPEMTKQFWAGDSQQADWDSSMW